jgi:hypothetical protein
VSQLSNVRQFDVWSTKFAARMPSTNTVDIIYLLRAFGAVLVRVRVLVL